MAKAGNLSPFVTEGAFPLTSLGEVSSMGGCLLDVCLNGNQSLNPTAKLVNNHAAHPGYYPGHHKRVTGISQKNLTHMAEEPQCYWMPLSGHEKWAKIFAQSSGRVVLCQSFRFNTMRRLAALISKPVQASHYWPITLHGESEEKLKALTLWLNSTPALLSIAHSCSLTAGAKVMFSQGAAKELPVLDFAKLTDAQLQELAVTFDAVAETDGFEPIPHMENDPARKMIDDALSEAFGVGDLAPLRAALAAEPIITDR